jgi:hypothetical protein
MSFQIRDIVLYSLTGEVRTVTLELGRVNIITGASKSGKTALIDVIDFCLGGDDCHVAQGPMRRAVSWYGLRLQLDVGQLFIARRSTLHRTTRPEARREDYVRSLLGIRFRHSHSGL